MSIGSFIRPIQRRGAVFIAEDGTTVITDLTLTESPTAAGKLTEHPIERGSKTTDHYADEFDTLSLTEFVTNTPDDDGELQQDRDFNTFEALKALKESRQPLTVVTPMNVYEDMFIERLSTSRGSAAMQALEITVELKRALFSTVQLVAVPEAIRSARNKRSQAEADLGRQNAEDIGAIADSATVGAAAGSGNPNTAANQSSSTVGDTAGKTPEQQASSDQGSSILGSLFP